MSLVKAEGLALMLNPRRAASSLARSGWRGGPWEIPNVSVFYDTRLEGESGVGKNARRQVHEFGSSLERTVRRDVILGIAFVRYRPIPWLDGSGADRVGIRNLGRAVHRLPPAGAKTIGPQVVGLKGPSATNGGRESGPR